MECTEEKYNDRTIIGLRGRMDSVTARTVEEKLLALIENGERHLVVDCAELTYVSSAGLRVFLMAAKRVTQVKGQLIFTTLNDEVRQVFDLTGFSSILQVCSSREEAITQAA
ncbi:MAG TPA: STAS domain-containing protein [Blastocatellia bacterium]|nr:STAS domain-containing protein [Blastocatellia bacterium]